MSYQRFKKGGWVAKSLFLAKSVQKLLNKKIKTDFFSKKQPFLNRRLLRNGSFFNIVMFHMVNVKRVVLSLLFRSYHRIRRLQFLIRWQSRTVLFICRGGSKYEVAVLYDLKCPLTKSRISIFCSPKTSPAD